MSFGKTIRIYLKNGSVTGIRHSEIFNWSGQAIFIPRLQIKELVEWNEAKRPGIYFLFGVDENGYKATYIGESENIFKRLNDHLQKDFWNEAVFFTSKDDNLTKSHIKYLESRLIEISKNSTRYAVLNGNDATLSVLPRSDKDSMEEFLNNIRILLGTMGHKVLEPKIIDNSEQATSFNTKENNKNIELTLHSKNVFAQAIYTNEGIVVKKGSTVNQESKPSLGQGSKNLKEMLVNSGILKIKSDNLYEFTEDYLFNSSSQAAEVILGSPTSGPQRWYSNGKTLKELENS